MIEHTIDIPQNLDDRTVTAAVQRICAREDLTLGMKTSLKKYPGCTHWHFKRHAEKGILEVTWWPGTGEKRPSQLWLSCHGNRGAAWITELMPRLTMLIENAFRT
ncbi:hypothetical protein ABVF61_15900 [Roseibium sp. HPY-6]|uniref:hypothetical protein n=1 Tax=Roseibium sp. HPY-6 TaxID=3229852 RepID=UPI00338DB72B